ncbi:MAG: DMT family transporter [Rhodobacteraceae bacterium]|nr:DMT family transporter [Paracoccaceae bacterium]
MPPAPQTSQHGIPLMMLAILLFTTMDAVAKLLIASYPAPQVIWARFAGMCLIVLLILRARVMTVARTRYPGLHFWRSASQFGATGLFFLSLGHIGLAEATAIVDINPVLVTVGAALFLGERFGPRRAAGVIAALIGAMIIIRPGSSVFTPAALLPLGAALCYSANVLLTRFLGQQESPWTAMLYASAFGTLAGAVALPFVWHPVALQDLPWFVLVALLGTGAQLCIIRAFSITEAAVLAPFGYMGLVFSAIWGIVLFGQYPDRWTVLGALVIAAAGLYVWHRETGAKGR